MSNKPQTPLNSPEMSKDTTSVMTPEVPVTTSATVAATTSATVPLSMKDTTDKSVPLPTVQPPTDDRSDSNNDPSGNGEFDPEFPIVAAVSEFTIEAAEECIRARHDSGYVFEGTYAEFNRHARESIKLFKHA